MAVPSTTTAFKLIRQNMKTICPTSPNKPPPHTQQEQERQQKFHKNIVDSTIAREICAIDQGPQMIASCVPCMHAKDFSIIYLFRSKSGHLQEVQ